MQTAFTETVNSVFEYQTFQFNESLTACHLHRQRLPPALGTHGNRMQLFYPLHYNYLSRYRETVPIIVMKKRSY